MKLDMGHVTSADIERITDRFYLTRGDNSPLKLSAFWVLLILAGVIAAAGVTADSVATVIGAMIVAPLMTPILGTAVALVLSNRRQMLTNLGLVLAGVVLVVAIGYFFGLITALPVNADTNSQVAARVSPKLIDLVAALATGCVGAFAAVRSDVSDTLPGVAIAISLVPPLAVVGLTLEAGEPGQAAGAMLLFLTNVTAIIATGTVVLLLYKVRQAALDAGVPVGSFSPRTLTVLAGMILLVAIPLGFGTYRIVNEQLTINKVRPVAVEWAKASGWSVNSIDYTKGGMRIVVVGTPPRAETAALRDKLDAAGLTDLEPTVDYIYGTEETVGKK